MYKNLGAWLSPSAGGRRPAVAASADSSGDEDADAAEDEAGDGCSSEAEEDSAASTSGCRVVNSHVVSLATSSTWRRRDVQLSEPVALVFSHLRVSF